MLARALCAALVIVSCAPVVADEDVAVARAPILGGAADTTTTDVFLLALTYDNGDTGFCTATLISPRTLLTAAHCADPAEKGANTVEIKATNKPTSTGLMPSDVLDVVDRRLHPQWNNSSRPQGKDIALLLLPAPVTNATPRAFERSLTQSLVNQSVRAVGYGRTSAANDDSGTRRAVMSTVKKLDAETFDIGVAGTNGICFGDSGGPSLLTVNGSERLVGVHSYGTTSQCGAGADVRVDQHLSFIDGWLAEKEPAQCSADGRCVANCIPDDADCTADGMACTDAAQCSGRVCATFCTRSCTGDGQCKNGMTCFSGQCSKMARPTALRGEMCTQGVTACEAGTVCTAPEGSPTICRQACETSDAGVDRCPTGAACTTGQGGLRFCFAGLAPPVDAGTNEMPPVQGGTCATAPELLFIGIAGIPVRRLFRRRR